MKNFNYSMPMSNLKSMAWPFLQRAGRYIASIGMQASGSIANVFDGLFSNQHFSWRCFYRSCLASFLSVAACFLTMLGVMGIDSLSNVYRNSQLNFGQRIQGAGFEFSSAEYLVWVLVIPLVMNLLPDYMALYKTRHLMGWVGQRKTFWSAGCALIIDQVGTYLSFFLGLLLATIVVMAGVLGGELVWEVFQEPGGVTSSVSGHLLHLLAAMNQPVVMIPCVVSTFFSSFWLWLFGFSIIFPKISDIGSWLGNRIRILSAPSLDFIPKSK